MDVPRPVSFVEMTDPQAFDDPGPLPPAQPSRLRRGLQVAVVLLLVASMVFLAWVSGRGEVVVVPIATPSANPAVAGASRLAIVDAAGHLVTTDPAGKSRIAYGPPGVAYAFPAWSPDGSRLAALAKDADGSAIHVFGIAADGAAALAPAIVFASPDREPFYLYWSPDSDRVSFLTTEPGELALRIAPADAAAPATIVRTGAPMYWAWSSGSGLLVHSGGQGTGAFLGDIADDGTAVRPAADPPGAFRAPAVSPDGRHRAFVAPASDGPGRVVVVATDGSDRHEAPVFGDAAFGFGRSGDLAFIGAERADQAATLPVGPLRLLETTSGRVRVLLPGTVVGFFWAPDGRTIAALQLAAPGDDKVADAGGGIGPFAATSGFALSLTFVDVASGGVRSRQAVRVADLFVNQVLPYFDQYALSHGIWSSDSATIALPLVDDTDTTGVVVLHADGSAAQRVSDGVAAFWSR